MNINQKEILYYSKWNGIRLTKSAAKYILHFTKKDSNLLGLKIGVRNFGCAGFSYIFKKFYVKEYIKIKYLVYERDNAKIYISLKDMPFLDGSELDYVNGDLNKFLKINNSNIKRYCGCGISFNIENILGLNKEIKK